jgi:hypothetical protein
VRLRIIYILGSIDVGLHFLGPVREKAEHLPRMPSGKDRLYIALYARSGALKMPGGEDKWVSPRSRHRLKLNFNRYHWSFIISPKSESKGATGRRCHAKETIQNVTRAVQNV